jgi:hypothetical protein
VAGDQHDAGHGPTTCGIASRNASKQARAAASGPVATATGRHRREAVGSDAPSAACSRIDPRSSVAGSRAAGGSLRQQREQPSLGADATRRRRVVEREQGEHGFVMLTGFDRERPLSRRRQHDLEREIRVIKPLEVEGEPVNTGRGEHDSIVPPLTQPANAGGDVAAERAHLQFRAQCQQLGRAAR